MAHQPPHEEHRGRREKVPVRAGLAAVAFAIGTAALSYLILRPARPDLVGSWVGRDSVGVEVVYQFDQDSTGFRLVGGRREAFRYVFTRGYPNGVSVTFGDTLTLRGIADVGSRVLRIELADPGAPPPRRLSESALELRRPAAR